MTQANFLIRGTPADVAKKHGYVEIYNFLRLLQPPIHQQDLESRTTLSNSKKGNSAGSVARCAAEYPNDFRQRRFIVYATTLVKCPSLAIYCREKEQKPEKV